MAGQSNTVSTFTNGSGVYTLNLSETESPVTISVAPANHVAASVSGVAFVANDTIDTDFDLVLAESCADVSEEAISTVLEPDGLGSIALAIGNAEGGADLEWLVETEGRVSVDSRGTPACSSPGAVSWLGVTPSAGTVAAGSSGTVAVDFNASGLAAGLYEANLCVSTNDTVQGDPVIPVMMEIKNDAMFWDRFEQ